MRTGSYGHVVIKLDIHTDANALWHYSLSLYYIYLEVAWIFICNLCISFSVRVKFCESFFHSGFLKAKKYADFSYLI